MGQPVVAGNQFLGGGAGVFMEITSGCGCVGNECGRLTEGAGGLVVNWCRDRLPGATNENCRAGYYGRGTGRPSGPVADSRQE